MLADFYKNQHRYDKAEEALKAALGEMPKDLQLQVALAELQFELQKFDEARAGMEAILAKTPGNGGAILAGEEFPD